MKKILLILSLLSPIGLQAQINLVVNRANGDLTNNEGKIITNTYSGWHSDRAGDKWTSNSNSCLSGVIIQNKLRNSIGYFDGYQDKTSFYFNTNSILCESYTITAPENYRIAGYNFDIRTSLSYKNSPVYVKTDADEVNSTNYEYLITGEDLFTVSTTCIKKKAQFAIRKPSNLAIPVVKNFTIILIEEKDPNISFSSSTGIIYANGQKQLPTLNNPLGIKVSYYSSNPSVALSNEETGYISPINFGSTKITVSWDEQIIDGVLYRSGSASYDLVVSALIPEKDTDTNPSFTIIQADYGLVSTKVPVGSSYTFTIKANDGWRIHSVSFNDEDVTSQLNDKMEFITPAITENSTLCVVYEEDVPSAMPSLRNSTMKIKGTSYGARVTDASLGDIIQIYSKDGILQNSVNVNSEIMDIPLAKGDVYIIKVGDKTLKLKH